MKNNKKKNRKNKKKNNFLDKVINIFFTKRYQVDFLDIVLFGVIVCVMSCFFTNLIIRVRLNENIKFNSIIGEKASDKLISVYNEIVNKYYEEIDEESLVQAGIDGMIKHLEDKYSIYIDTDNIVDQLDSTYDGIGVVTIENVVSEVYKDSSAYRAGVKSGDIIIGVNDKDISKDNYQELGTLLRENNGENKLKVKRNEEELVFDVVIEKITIPTVTYNQYKLENKRVGYIKISSMAKNTFEEFREALIELEKEELYGLIVDVRNNNGGYIDSAYNIASIFIDKRKNIYTLKSRNNEKTYVDETKEVRDYKVVVLINKSTASSAEILASSLKISYGAELVGYSTFGKGKVQTIKYFDDTALKYTSSEWLCADGTSIEGKGIEPDYKVENEIKDNVLIDLQFDKALSLFK